MFGQNILFKFKGLLLEKGIIYYIFYIHDLIKKIDLYLFFYQSKFLFLKNKVDQTV